jgi:hypothetical protein
MAKLKKKTKEDKVKLDMTFEEAMKKALNTPLPKSKKRRQNKFFEILSLK